MSFPVATISENALLYEALLFFKRKSISHIACLNSEGLVIGGISYTSLMATQQNAISFMIKEIETVSDSKALLKFQQRLAVLVNALVESGDKPQNISRIITSISDAIVHRVVSLSIAKLGTPPCSFAFVVMGSEGRQEQTLATDQDNAIVFENLEGEELNIAFGYFRKLGQEVCRRLNEAGYKLCKGDVMAQNPKWTQPPAIWQNHFSNWLNSSDPQSILDSSIFFDFRAAYGNKTLVNELRLFVNQELKHKPVFFYHMAQSIINYKAPINIFGKILKENHSKDKISLDIKKIILPIISFVRLYALEANIIDTNTLDRLKLLYLKQIIDKKMYNNLVLAYNYLMHIRFRSQAKLSISNQIPHNLIDINTLTHIELATIKKFFEEIAILQSKLSFDYKGSM
jgi:CBS domain-containing protein